MSEDARPVKAVLTAGACCLGIALAALISAVDSSSAQPWPHVLLAAAALCCLAIGVALPRRLAPLYGAVAAGSVILLVLQAPDGLSGAPLAGPLGYGNANGALCAQGTAAAMIPVLTARARWLRPLGLLMALSLVLMAWATGSLAGFGASLLCLFVPLAVALTPVRHRMRAASAVVVAAATFASTVLVLTGVLATTHAADQSSSGVFDRLAAQGLSERRVVLWSEAVDLLVANPGTGVGAGRFQEESATANRDDDARWAHSGFLQYGAETGLLGLLSLLGLTGCMFFVMWRTCRSNPVAAIGACATGAVATHATIDYVLHFPSVPLLAVATVGVCAGCCRMRLSDMR